MVPNIDVQDYVSRALQTLKILKTNNLTISNNLIVLVQCQKV